MPLCLEGPPPFRDNNLWRVPSGAIFLIELTALYLTYVLVLLFNFFKHSIRENLISFFKQQKMKIRSPSAEYFFMLQSDWLKFQIELNSL